VKHDGEIADRPPAAPAAAPLIFGSRLPLAEQFVGLLADTGVSHGLVGPREVPRLWERHVLNCAVLTDLLPNEAFVVDIGSGAGLPGITLAIRRPDLSVLLVEPLLRRVTWLTDVVAELGLGSQVSIKRARAEEVAGELTAPFVTARAVAALDRLVGWGVPLLADGGSLLAIKGRTASEEVAAAASLLTRVHATASVIELGGSMLAQPTTVVRIDRIPGTPATVLSPAPGRPPRQRRRR
jgi:16S rRNA (guanine527-N7)-methyltransferase